MTKMEVFIAAMIILVIAAILAIGVDRIMATPVVLGAGTVLDKDYVPSKTETFFSVHPDEDGNLTTSLEEVYTPERWVVVVQFEGQTVSLDTSSDMWSAVKENGPCTVIRMSGLIMFYEHKILVGEHSE